MGFDRGDATWASIICMMQYSWNDPFPYMFTDERLAMTLGQVISAVGPASHIRNKKAMQSWWFINVAPTVLHLMGIRVPDSKPAHLLSASVFKRTPGKSELQDKFKLKSVA